MSIHRTLVPVGEVSFEDDTFKVSLDGALIVDDTELTVIARSVYGVDIELIDIDGMGTDHIRLGCDALALARLIDVLTSARQQMLELDPSQPKAPSDNPHIYTYGGRS